MEHRASLRILYCMIAAETMLLDMSRPGQSFLLARRSVYLLCGDHERESCGRDRPTCPIIAVDPTNTANRRRLDTLRVRGREDLRWRCSEWHHVLDWYATRSGVVHGGDEVEEDDADKALFWLVARLVPAVLGWFADHPSDPIGDLDAVLEALPAPPDWERLIPGPAI